MSNRANRAMADAYFAADVAATKRIARDEKEKLIDQYNKILEEMQERSEKAAEDASEGFFGDLFDAAIGIGTFLVTGNPMLALSAYNISSAVNEGLYQIIPEGAPQDVEDLKEIATEMEDYDWTLSQEAKKYSTLRDAGEAFEDIKTDESEKAGKTGKALAEQFDQPWMEDLISYGGDIALSLATMDAKSDFFNKGMGSIAEGLDAIGLSSWDSTMQFYQDKLGLGLGSGNWDFFKWAK
jgi:nitrogenase molybdenum-iron protein alpha/beta subunit